MYIEDQQLNLPSIENGIHELGDLYNCRTCEKVGFNLFARNLQKDEVSVSPISNSHSKLAHIKSMSDKVKSLEVDGSMSLDLISRLNIEGSATYDSNEANACLTETLSCDYRYDGYQVDLRSSARDAIHPNVSNMIVEKKIHATHVVKEVVIGGILNAKIKISKKDVKHQESIKGSCLGKLVYGKINASVKAKLEMLDFDESSNFSKNITISSSPHTDSNQPDSIKEMFTVISNFTSVINRETHYTGWHEKIRGVPIKFVLVPIAQYLQFNVEKLYVQLEYNIFEQFKNLLLRLQDYSSAEYVQRQIINRDEDTSLLLMNDQSDISLKVSCYGEKLRVKVKDVYQQAVSLLGRYRHGNVKPDVLLCTLNEFEKLVDSYEVIQQINSLYEEAQKELTGMYYRILSKNNHIQVFSDKANVKKWFVSEAGCKILLQTKSDQPEVFHKFNELSQELCTFGFEVAVVTPSASDNFSLSIKLDDKTKEYQSDIGYVLTILKCAVSRGADIEHVFVGLCSSMFCISLPIEPKDIRDINNLISNLVGYHNVYMARSRLDILARLGDSCADLKLFIPIEAFETSFDAISSFTTLHAKYSDVSWMVGPFLPNQLAAPMLLLFKRKSLLAACFDTVDLLHLDRILSNKKKTTGNDLCYDFSILSTGSYQDTFYGDRFEYVKELLTILKDTNALVQLTGAKFWNSLDLTVNECTSDVLLLLQATALNDDELFKRRLAAVVLRKVRNMSWDNAEDEMKRCNDVPKLIDDLELELKQQSPPVAQTSEIASLIKNYKKVEKSIEENEQTVQQEILVSLCRLFGLTDDELRKTKKFIRDRHYRNAAAMVSRHKYGHKMCAFNTHMLQMDTIQSFHPLLDAVTKSGFIESAELWKNEKFLHLVQENLHSEPFLRRIVIHFNYAIPGYIPLQMKDVFDKILMENRDYEFPSTIKSTQDFESFDDFMQRFDMMLLKNEAYDEFNRFIYDVLKSKLENRNSYTEEEIERNTEEIWISLKDIASRRQIVNIVESTINEEVKVICKKLDIDVYRAYIDDKERRLYNMYQIVLSNSPNVWSNLTDAQLSCLKHNADFLPLHIVENFPIESFDAEMVKALVGQMLEEINDFLNKFKIIFKVKLNGKFKSEYTAHVLKGFKSHMIEMVRTWRKSKDPLEILKMKKNHYTTMIRTRLRHGFSYYGDGLILSEYVLRAISTESIKFANDARVKNMLGVDWFTCSESIRFKCFRELIDDIRGGNKETGTNYFLNPQYYFKKWFQRKVDTSGNNSVAREAFIETFDREYNVFSNIIMNCHNNGEELFSKITEILSAEGIEYKPSSTFKKGLCKNLASFISGLQDGLKNVTAKESFDRMQLSPLSEDDIILKRVGCIVTCAFCGAMCLGAHGHDKNAGDMKMHHTLHQPEGLAGHSYRGTRLLSIKSCNEEVESNIWYQLDRETTWGTIKENDWLYEQSSSEIEFGDMMIWFFKELQEEIAARMKLLPIPKQEINFKYGWIRIASIDAIVARIESALADLLKLHQARAESFV